MVDLPDYIYAFEAERLEAGPVRVTADDVPGYDGKYIEYIRSDLVPQWQPIETLTQKQGEVLLTIIGMFTRIGFVNSEGELRHQDGSIIKGWVTHWMPIPKVPE